MDCMYAQPILPEEIPDPERLEAWPLNGVNLHEIYYNSYDCLFITDGEGKILTFNPAAERLLGFKLDFMNNMTVQACLERGLYEQSTTLGAIQRRQRVTGLVRSKIGVTLLATSTPLMDDEGNIRLVITNSYNREYMMRAQATIVQQERDRRDRYRSVASYLGERVFAGKKIVAESPAMRNVLKFAESIADSDSTVLLTGESGTGKDFVASFIHHHSNRSREPFIPVNCAAIPDQLMESEFFGYERGAFTGAGKQGKPGLFEIADGGTLLLDEIGELPLLLQSKLLRALETGEIQRIGGTKTRRVNVRIMAATNRDLHAMVEAKQFRHDLFYRLNVLPITLPSLSARREDILPLARLFLDEYNRRNSKETQPTQKAEQLLLNYPWPGNIRELRNLIERLAVISRNGLIDEDICRATLFPSEDTTSSGPFASNGATLDTLESLRDFRARTEEKYLRHAYTVCKGNVPQMAKQLGVHKTGLYRKLHELGIQPERGASRYT